MTKIIKAFRMLDINNGDIIYDPIINIKNNRIMDINGSGKIRNNDEIINLGDVVLLPGLIDVHTHITYNYNKRGKFDPYEIIEKEEEIKNGIENCIKTLKAGFTTIRNLGTSEYIDVKIRDMIEKKEIIGPRIFASGEPIMKRDDIERQIKERIKMDVDWIKVFNEGGEFNKRDIEEIVKKSDKYDISVAVHAHDKNEIIEASKGGCRTIEHGTFMDDNSIEKLYENGTYLIPTLYLPNHYMGNKERFEFDEETWEFFNRMRIEGIKNGRKAYRKGVKIGYGTDAVAGINGNNGKEFKYLMEMGMTELEAIKSATIINAEILGVSEYIGRIEKNKLADIIGIKDNPLEDINNIFDIKFVMKDGIRYV